jgi:hypothetical protein
VRLEGGIARKSTPISISIIFSKASPRSGARTKHGATHQSRRTFASWSSAFLGCSSSVPIQPFHHQEGMPAVHGMRIDARSLVPFVDTRTHSLSEAERELTAGAACGALCSSFCWHNRIDSCAAVGWRWSVRTMRFC